MIFYSPQGAPLEISSVIYLGFCLEPTGLSFLFVISTALFGFAARLLVFCYYYECYCAVK